MSRKKIRKSGGSKRITLVPRAAKSAHEIDACLLALAEERGDTKTFCPSEVARRLFADAWRESMPQVRTAAVRLVKAGKLRCTQGGHAVDPASARGPLRFSRDSSA